MQGGRIPAPRLISFSFAKAPASQALSCFRYQSVGAHFFRLKSVANRSEACAETHLTRAGQRGATQRPPLSRSLGSAPARRDPSAPRTVHLRAILLIYTLSQIVASIPRPSDGRLPRFLRRSSVAAHLRTREVLCGFQSLCSSHEPPVSMMLGQLLGTGHGSVEAHAYYSPVKLGLEDWSSTLERTRRRGHPRSMSPGVSRGPITQRPASLR
jgi:hypothetical protein